MTAQVKPILDAFRDRLGENPTLDALKDAAKYLAWAVFTECGEQQVLADWVNNGLDPDYQSPQTPRSPAESPQPDDSGERLAGGIRYDSWAHDYAEALTHYLLQRMREDPLVIEHRAKYGTVEADRESVVWNHVLALVKASGVDAARKNPKLARFYLHLGKSEPEGEDRESIPIPENPVPELADLLSAIRELAARYRVSNAAALFAITQDAFTVHHTPYKVRKLDGEAPFRRIVLEVDPKLPAEDVKAIYLRARAKFKDELGWKFDPINRKNLELAEHASIHNEAAWEDLLKWWAFGPGRRKEEHLRYLPEFPRFSPETRVTDAEVERAYDDYYRKRQDAEKNFMRDVNAAWRWVFGSEPPKRKELGESTALLKAACEEVERLEAQPENERRKAKPNETE